MEAMVDVEWLKGFTAREMWSRSVGGACFTKARTCERRQRRLETVSAALAKRAMFDALRNWKAPILPNLSIPQPPRELGGSIVRINIPVPVSLHAPRTHHPIEIRDTTVLVRSFPVLFTNINSLTILLGPEPHQPNSIFPTAKSQAHSDCSGFEIMDAAVKLAVLYEFVVLVAAGYLLGYLRAL